MRARLALVAIGGAAVLAPLAHGAGTEPRLVVHGRTAKAASEVILRHVGAASTALVLVPGGYTLTLGQPAGATVGAASADQLIDGGTRTLSGAVTTAPPGTLACDGVAHAATWSVALGDGTQTLVTLTVAADSAPAQLLVCLSGSQVDRLTLQLAATVLVPPAQPARPVWEALVSLADGSQVASVATLALPAKLTLRATYQRIKHLIAVSGVVLEAGAAAPTSRRVVVSIGKQASTLTTIGATRTKPDGSWRGVITNVKRTLYVQAQAIVPEADTTATACTPPTLTAPCVSATSAGYTASSAVVRVAVPAK
ncbi:MAG: hypothetical protein QOH73_212 [Gaiellaceae bacterium]|nr:hypothetical protein [Gaiellaceae bacterium]